MYNVRVLKYPTGYQYRIYSRPVGFKMEADKDPKEPIPVEIWNEDVQEFETVYANPNNIWVNPFTEQIETEPYTDISDKVINLERSIKNSMSRTVNNIYHKARSNTWDWFVTLTFNPSKVDSFDFDICVQLLSKWLNNQRRNCPDMKYLFVPELHKSGRWHFHGLMANCSELDFVESGHFDHGKPIYNIGRYKLGFSTATRVVSNERVTKYISKYITKELCAVSSGRKRFWCSRNLEECPVEELLIEPGALERLLTRILPQSKHVKKIAGGEVTTTYIEMGENENE